MVREIAQKVYDAVMLDSSTFLSPACMVDYGLDKGDFQGKFGALQTAARSGATEQDFDDALGSGLKLTELVAKYGSNVQFEKTVWDILEEQEKKEEEDSDEEDYPEDDGDGDSAAMELQENQDFAQDGEFENMTGDGDGFGSNFG